MILFEFSAPAPAVSATRRVSRQVRYQREGLWREAAWIAAMAHTNRVERPQRRSLVHVTLPVASVPRRREPSDFTTTVSLVVDGLVHAGLWPDDTPEFVKTDEPSFWTASTVLVEISMIGVDV